MRRLLLCCWMAACSPQKGDPGPMGPTGPTGAMGATGPAASPAPGLQRTVIVSPVGTTTQNGAALVQALAGITADDQNPALLSLEPGEYDVGALPLAMKSFVDVEGSGEGTTVIKGSGGEAVTAAAGMQMRFVTVTNSSATGAAVRAKSATGFSLSHVTLNATGVGWSVEDDGFLTADNLTVFSSGTGIRCTTSKAAGPNLNFRDGFISANNAGGDLDGINALGCNLELDGVELSLTGQSGAVAGIRVGDTGMSAGDLRLSDVIVEATCPTCTVVALTVSGAAQGANADVWSSRLRAFGNTPVAVALTKGGAGPATANIADTLLGGAVNNSGGTYHCIGNYDGSFAAVSCP